jgi:xanthine dehydrogenase accessory factor
MIDDPNLSQAESQGAPFVRVILVDAAGSAPQDAGSKMLVTESGLAAGTIGGGKVEARAIDEARKMLADPSSPATKFFEWNLHTDIGMTCGGIVRVYFEVCNRDAWQIAVFGAGHIAQATIRLLLTLPCRINCIDPRAEWLSKLPSPAPALQIVRSDDPSSIAQQLSDRTFVLCMTQGHKSDYPVLRVLLSRPAALPYVGVIGSASKSAILKRELLEAGVPADRIERIHCPVGLPIGSNHPGEIAVSIAAQLLAERDKMTPTTAPIAHAP